MVGGLSLLRDALPSQIPRNTFINAEWSSDKLSCVMTFYLWKDGNCSREFADWKSHEYLERNLLWELEWEKNQKKTKTNKHKTHHHYHQQQQEKLQLEASMLGYPCNLSPHSGRWDRRAGALWAQSGQCSELLVIASYCWDLLTVYTTSVWTYVPESTVLPNLSLLTPFSGFLYRRVGKLPALD